MGAVLAAMTTGQPMGLEDPTENEWNAATRLLLSSRKMLKLLKISKKISTPSFCVCLSQMLFLD